MTDRRIGDQTRPMKKSPEGLWKLLEWWQTAAFVKIQVSSWVSRSGFLHRAEGSVDSKKLEHGHRRIDAGLPSFLDAGLEDSYQSCPLALCLELHELTQDPVMDWVTLGYPALAQAPAQGAKAACLVSKKHSEILV